MKPIALRTPPPGYRTQSADCSIESDRATTAVGSYSPFYQAKAKGKFFVPIPQLEIL